MDPLTAGFLFGAELLKLINSMPEDMKREGWQEWRDLWKPIIAGLVKK